MPLEDKKIVFILKTYENMIYEEIAQARGMKIGTVRKRGLRLKMSVFPLSLAAQVAAGLLLINPPLINSGTPPPVKIYDTFLAPVAPPPLPLPPIKKYSSEAKIRIKSFQTQVFVQTRKLIGPAEIPQEIAEEQVSDFGV